MTPSSSGQSVTCVVWSDGAPAPRAARPQAKNGCDDTQFDRQRFGCKGCRNRFDALTDTVIAGHHQPLRAWVAGLYLLGLNFSRLQIAREIGIDNFKVETRRAMASFKCASTGGNASGRSCRAGCASLRHPPDRSTVVSQFLSV